MLLDLLLLFFACLADGGALTYMLGCFLVLKEVARKSARKSGAANHGSTRSPSLLESTCTQCVYTKEKGGLQLSFHPFDMILSPAFAIPKPTGGGGFQIDCSYNWVLSTKMCHFDGIDLTEVGYTVDDVREEISAFSKYVDRNARGEHESLEINDSTGGEGYEVDGIDRSNEAEEEASDDGSDNNDDYSDDNEVPEPIEKLKERGGRGARGGVVGSVGHGTGRIEGRGEKNGVGGRGGRGGNGNGRSGNHNDRETSEHRAKKRPRKSN